MLGKNSLLEELHSLWLNKESVIEKTYLRFSLIEVLRVGALKRLMQAVTSGSPRFKEWLLIEEEELLNEEKELLLEGALEQEVTPLSQTSL